MSRCSREWRLSRLTLVREDEVAGVGLLLLAPGTVAAPGLGPPTPPHPTTQAAGAPGAESQSQTLSGVYKLGGRRLNG